MDKYKPLLKLLPYLIALGLMVYIYYPKSPPPKCADIERGKAPIEIYNYSCDENQLKSMKKNEVSASSIGYLCGISGNEKTKKIACTE
jgi:hypothetical protein